MISDSQLNWSIPVDPAFGFSRVRLEASVPELPGRPRAAVFGEHIVDRNTGNATNEVVALKKGAVVISQDNGRTWDQVDLREAASSSFVNCFTTRSGSHLLQVKSPAATLVDDLPPDRAAVYRFSHEWKLLDVSQPGNSHWHGSCSVDQSGETIMYAEYPSNKMKYRLPTEGEPDLKALDIRTPAVFRSRDDGASWEQVFSIGWRDIRHFHTLAADPFEPGTWLLSSGDQPNECRVWRSRDDGERWCDISKQTPDLPLHRVMRGRMRSIFRYTDIFIDRDRLIWGTDDWLGGPPRIDDKTEPYERRAGSRILLCEKSDSLVPRVVGYVGNPVRSLIDVGPALLLMTEAKREVLPEPQLVLVSKHDPTLVAEVGTVSAVQLRPTGFSFSRASRRAKDGVFFSNRGRYDITDSVVRMARWKIDFD